LAAFGRRPLLYVAPLSLAGIRNPTQLQKLRLAGNDALHRRVPITCGSNEV